MNPKTLAQILAATDGKLIGTDPSLIIQSICTDTRKISPGCLFIALKGENHDGHDHVQTALDTGATAALVHRQLPINIPQVLVDDTRKAMGRLGNYIRHLLQGKVIAVAGSNGKTGTKNLIHSVLKHSLNGTISPKSFNNDIGVPSTIFDAAPADDYLVLELGTQHPGEIINLTTIAEPDIAIITNIGAEHLEFLGDLDGVTKENAQIIAGLNPQGLLIINGDCRHLIRAVESYPGKTITFGLGEQNDLSATDVRCRGDGVYFRLETQTPVSEVLRRSGSSRFSNDEFFIPLMGKHTAVNALAAIAVARYLGLSDAQISTGLATATGPEMRLQLQTAGSVKILNDAYNANPHSMQAGLETLRDMETQGRRIAILGDMRELGQTADRYHREIGQFAAGCNLDHLVCVGEKSAFIAAAAKDAGMDADCIERYSNSADCAANISSIVTEGDLVLLKASRGIKLESVATAIQTAAAGNALRREIAARTRRVVKTSQHVSTAI